MDNIVFIIILSIFLSFFIPNVPEDTGTFEETTCFAYDISEGEEFIYNISTNTELNFVNDEIYEKVENLVEEEENGLPYYFDTFNLTHFMEGLENMVSKDFDVNYNITKIYREIKNVSNDGGYAIENDDIFNGSIRMKLNNSNNWVTPNVITKIKLDEIEQFLKNNFNLTVDEIDILEEGINNTKQDVDSDIFNWDNKEFSRIAGKITNYYLNGSLNEKNSNVDEPTPPIEDFTGLEGLPYYLPNNWNFTKWGDYIGEMTEYEKENTESGETNFPFSSFADIKEKVGITQFHTTKTSVGAFISLGEVNMSFFEDYATEQNLPINDLEKLGIKEYYGGIVVSLEYFDDMSLLCYKLHINGTALLDLRMIDNLPEEIEQLEIVDEEINVIFDLEVVRNGYFAPTIQQIMEGELGENRDPTKDPNAPSGFFGKTPGYSLGFVAIIGLIIVSAITLKYKFRK